RSAGDEISVADAVGRGLHQSLGELLCRFRREEARMGIGKLLSLPLQRGYDVRMIVPQAGNGRSSRSVDIRAPFAVIEFHPLATNGDGQIRVDLAMQYIGHERFPCRVVPAYSKIWTLSSASCRSVRAIASRAASPPSPATRAARISTAANAGVMAWKKEGRSVPTKMAYRASRATGDAGPSVSATMVRPLACAWRAASTLARV